jgi:hypothetical protein
VLRVRTVQLGVGAAELDLAFYSGRVIPGERTAEDPRNPGLNAAGVHPGPALGIPFADSVALPPRTRLDLASREDMAVADGVE